MLFFWTKLADIALIKNNAKVGAEIAVGLSASKSRKPSPSSSSHDASASASDHKKVSHPSLVNSWIWSKFSTAGWRQELLLLEFDSFGVKSRNQGRTVTSNHIDQSISPAKANLLTYLCLLFLYDSSAFLQFLGWTFQVTVVGGSILDFVVRVTGPDFKVSRPD